MDIDLSTMEQNFFGSRLAEMRRAKRKRQKEIAYAADIDASYLAALERGRRTPPRLKVMTRLAVALGMSNTEKQALYRAALLSDLARRIKAFSQTIRGADVALELLDTSDLLSDEEIEALAILLKGFQYRALIPRRSEDHAKSDRIQEGGYER